MSTGSIDACFITTLEMIEADPLNFNINLLYEMSAERLNSAFYSSSSYVYTLSPFIILIILFHKWNWSKLFFTYGCLSACVRPTHVPTSTSLFNVSFLLISSLTSAQCDFQSSIEYHLERCAFPFFSLHFFFSPSLSWMAREARGSGEERRRGKNGKVMSDGCFVCVCHSQLLNFAF